MVGGIHYCFINTNSFATYSQITYIADFRFGTKIEFHSHLSGFVGEFTLFSILPMKGIIPLLIARFHQAHIVHKINYPNIKLFYSLFLAFLLSFLEIMVII